MHLQPLYENSPMTGGGVSEHLFEDGLCLPSGSSLTGEQFERVIDVIRSVGNW